MLFHETQTCENVLFILFPNGFQPSHWAHVHSPEQNMWQKSGKSFSEEEVSLLQRKKKLLSWTLEMEKNYEKRSFWKEKKKNLAYSDV